MKHALLVAMLCAAALTSAAHAESLKIVGTGDGIPVFRALGAAFTAKNPDTTILVPPSIHSSGGIREVGTDREILGRIARPLKNDEKTLGLQVVPVFRQPAVFFAHPSTGVKNLSPEQLVKIFSGMAMNWQEFGGADLRIKVVRREEVDSTLSVLRDTLPGWKDLQFNPDRSKLATTTQDAIASVRTVPGAIGFGPFSADLDAGLVVLHIDGVAPVDLKYPSAVTLSLIYRETTVTKPALGFIDFIFTPQGNAIIRENGAIPLAREPKPVT
jgi:phosphate transport system substrate-binding protein